MKIRLFLVLTTLSLAFPWPAAADDWPQFHGPQRDNISKETGLLKTWPKGGPPLLWTYTEAGIGFSGPAVVGDRLFTMGGRNGVEYLIALDLRPTPTKTVKEIWAIKIGPLFSWPKGNEWGDGPRATPTVDGDLIFALGGQGILICAKTATGKEIWRKDLPKELAAEVNPIGGGLGFKEGEPKVGWGFTWSPLVNGDHLVCTPGGKQGTVAALDKKTGAVVWQSKDFTDQASYASPILAEVGGISQYIVLTNSGLTGVAAKDGATLWHFPKDSGVVTIPTPIFHDNYVYDTIGWSTGCDLVKLEASGNKIKATKIYSNKVMSNDTGGVILVDGHIYGYGKYKGWVCQDFLKGRQVWADKKDLAQGSLTCADGHLYCYGEEEGIVALVEVSTIEWKETGRLQIPRQTTLRKPSGKIWTHPVVAGGKLFLRDQDLIFCYDLK